MTEIRFLGHATFELTDAGRSVLIDPFLTGNPLAAASADELEPDVILLTHAHDDHFADLVPIARRTGATVVTMLETAKELTEDGLENVIGPNIGGKVAFDGGWVKLVPAWHSSSTPKGTATTATGLVVEFGGVTVYHLGDTALFSDMELIGRRHAIDVALVPIGGFFTMDPEDAIEAVRMIGPRQVIPCHYNTFPPIEVDVMAFKAEVESSTASEVVVLEPGQTHTP